MKKRTGNWGGSTAVRLGTECKELNIKEGDEVNVYIQNNKIIIEKYVKKLKDSNGGKFIVKE